MFDPAAFYGHHEYDIASTTLFGGYSKGFYDAYFKKIPKAKGFESRMTLYHLFHYLNHWYDTIILKINIYILLIFFIIFCDVIGIILAEVIRVQLLKPLKNCSIFIIKFSCMFWF